MGINYDPDQRPISSKADGDQLWDLLSFYLDGEATPEQAAQVEDLLRRDPSYAHELALLKGVSSAARSLVEVEPPASLRAAIMANTTQRATIMRRTRAMWERLRCLLTPQRAGLALSGACVTAVALTMIFTHAFQNPTMNRGMSLRELALAPRGHASTMEPTAPSKSRAPLHHSGFDSRRLPSLQLTRSHDHRAMVAYSGFHGRRTARGQIDDAAWVGSPLVEMGSVHRHHARSSTGRAAREQRPRAASRRTELPTAVADGYATVPDMDRNNEAMLRAAAQRSADSNPIAGNDGNGMKSPAAARAGADSSAMGPSGSAAAKVILHVARLQSPPDSRHFLPTADIRRELDARRMNYSPVVLDNIRHEEAGISVIGTHF